MLFFILIPSVARDKIENEQNKEDRDDHTAVGPWAGCLPRLLHQLWHLKLR